MTSPTAPGLLSVEAARDAVLAVAEPVGTERIQTADALGRVTAETVTASVSLPPGQLRDGRLRDPRRGHAGRREDAPIQLEVVGDIAAGAAPDVTVTPGSAARIATGAKLPPGADAVVPVEATTPIDAAGRLGSRGRDATGPLPATCLVHERVEPGGSVRAAGSDLMAGATLLGPGTGITAAVVALVAGAGVADIVVHRRPRIAVLATGDEVRAPGPISVRRASPMPTVPACARSSPRPAASRSTSASRRTTSTTS